MGKKYLISGSRGRTFRAGNNGLASLTPDGLVPSGQLAKNTGASNMSLGQDRIWHRRVMTGETAIDFGSGDTDARVTLTGLSWVSVNTLVLAGPTDTMSVDHGPEDALLEELRIVADKIIANVGFDLIAHAPHGSYGVFNIAWMGI